MDRAPKEGECLKNKKMERWYLGTGEEPNSKGEVRVIDGFESSVFVPLSNLEPRDIGDVFGLVNNFLSAFTEDH